ncbi:MAG: glycosyltransferase [Legionella sp.]|nr:glycosyltransferase [Legionella sp.]
MSMSMEEPDDSTSICTSSMLLSEAKHAYESNKDNLRLLDKYIQLLIKHNELSTAKFLISDSLLLKKLNVESGLVHAHLLYKLKQYDDADGMFIDLISKFPDHIPLKMVYAQTLKKRRKLIKAYKLIQDINPNNLDRKQSIVYQDIRTIYRLVEMREARALRDEDDFGILSMKHAILYFKDVQTKPHIPNQLGKISLITGSLGPGGAERQLCLTAININKKVKSASSVANTTITEEVDVLINVFDSDDDKGFFLPLLKAHEVCLFQIKDMPSIALENLSLGSETLLTLLNETPSSIRYGLNRLVDYFRKAKTEVAFIWQDGAILFAALAALVARVPRIVLNLRGYPPSVRPHLFKPEYEIFYQSLANLPNVSFVTNTKATALAYAQWLNIPAQRFSIIYNGINAAPVIDANYQDEISWEKFNNQTIDASETIGGVFRFETDKRPILFIRFIKRYLHKHPKARFLLIGEGRLRKQCIELAEELKLANRILFVGLSKSVGYWMTKMDAMILLSLYEGLPNVLIEAQYMGIPVVSTPAGGACECFLEGETGYILTEAKEPDLFEVCQKVSLLIQSFKSDGNLKNKAKDFANSKFSIEGMVENTIKSLTRKPFSLSMEQSVCTETT